MDIIYSLNQSIDEPKNAPIEALENGNVLFFPDGSFTVNEMEQKFLTESILDGKHKNISYDSNNEKLGGLHDNLRNSEHEVILRSFMKRYADFARHLVTNHLPYYKDALIIGRTSYRPAQIAGRTSSKRKDDTRLHVDAFPATPVYGHRIMRVFTNIDFEKHARHWQVGEQLNDVINRFYPTVPQYSYIIAKCLHWAKATKKLRSRYDHYMLHIHDNMKLDDDYQRSVAKKTLEFPSQTSWIVYTDQVSHAALKGKQLLEQTFYLPVDAMANPSTAPLTLLLKRWENKEKAFN